MQQEKKQLALQAHVLQTVVTNLNAKIAQVRPDPPTTPREIACILGRLFESAPTHSHRYCLFAFSLPHTTIVRPSRFCAPRALSTT